MKTVHWATLALTALLGASALPALADDSTGPTNPAATGTVPAEIGVPSGTGTRMENGNVDGSAAPRAPGEGGTVKIKPQESGNAEGSSMGSSTVKPDSSSSDRKTP